MHVVGNAGSFLETIEIVSIEMEEVFCCHRAGCTEPSRYFQVFANWVIEGPSSQRSVMQDLRYCAYCYKYLYAMLLYERDDNLQVETYRIYIEGLTPQL